MPSPRSLISKLSADYPQFSFVESDHFLWSPTDATIYYALSPDAESLLLHELSHGILGHQSYDRDIELLAMERQAWDQAGRLAKQYALTVSDDTVQEHLDSYRDWLHARSTCPACTATGHQTGKKQYACVACGHQWRVNEARLCALRRYQLK